MLAVAMRGTSLILFYYVGLLALHAVVGRRWLEIIERHACCSESCRKMPCGFKIEDDCDSAAYFICYGDLLLHQRCAAGSTFDAEQQSCLSDGSANTTSATITETTTLFTTTKTTTPSTTPTTTPATTKTTTPSAISPSTTTSTPSTTTPNPCLNTTKITTASTRLTTPTTTASTTSARPTPTTTKYPKPTCTVEMHGLRIPNDHNCRMFWECVQTYAAERYCQIGMWYDRDHSVCNLQANVLNCPCNCG